MGPIHHKISMSNSDGDIKLDTIQNFLRGGNRILTGQQKEAVKQQLISTNRKVFEREHASVESLTALFAFDIKLVDLTTMHECGASDGYFDTEQGESEFVGFQVTRANGQPDKAFQMCTIHKSKDFLVHQVLQLLNHANQNLTTQQKEEVRQKLVTTNRLLFEREHVSIQDLKGLFADDIKIVDMTTMQECGAADYYFGYFNGEQGDSVFVGLQVTRANFQSDKAYKLCTVYKSKHFIIRQVYELGFVFIAMLYLDNQCRGILLLIRMKLGMTWSFMSVADVEVAVTRLLNTTVFAGVSIPLPILELRATCAFYSGFGCQQGHAREQEHYRQLIEEKSKENGKIVSQPALRKMDGSLLDAGDLEALNFKVYILHQNLLAVNARMIETALHRQICFMGLSTKTGYFLIVELAAASTTPWSSKNTPKKAE